MTLGPLTRWTESGFDIVGRQSSLINQRQHGMLNSTVDATTMSRLQQRPAFDHVLSISHIIV
jgi:hypothetical protein